MTAKELNEVNITVEAAISSEAEPKCGSPGEADGYKDTLQKSIQVKKCDDLSNQSYTEKKDFDIQHYWRYENYIQYFAKRHLQKKKENKLK